MYYLPPSSASSASSANSARSFQSVSHLSNVSSIILLINTNLLVTCKILQVLDSESNRTLKAIQRDSSVDKVAKLSWRHHFLTASAEAKFSRLKRFLSIYDTYLSKCFVIDKKTGIILGNLGTSKYQEFLMVVAFFFLLITVVNLPLGV